MKFKCCERGQTVMKNIRTLLAIALVVSGCTSYGPTGTQTDIAPPVAAMSDIQRPAAPRGEPFRFTVCSDNRPNGSRRKAFQWTLGEMNRLVGGEGAFFIMVGDFDPPSVTDQDLRAAFGAETIWYPVVGNHEAETGEEMAWVRDRYRHLPFIVRQGPPGSETTTFSFDYGSAHFVVLNEYFTGESDHAGNGDVCDALYAWLKADLDATDQPAIFVIGHEPAYPKHRHVGNSLDADPANRDRFWKLLNQRGVIAYFCGHTHTYSRLRQGSRDWPAVTWQVDVGNMGQAGRQTFVSVAVTDAAVTFDAYRGTPNKEFTECDTWTVPLDQGSAPRVDSGRLERRPGPAADEVLQLLTR
jgi:hypothetical protein